MSATEVEQKPPSAALSAVKTARFLTHLFFFCALASFCIWPLAVVAVPGFVLSYLAWVALVLFCFMNYSLGALVGLFLSVGTCVSLIVLEDPAGIAIGSLGILVLAFWTVSAISGHDPTTPRKKPLPARTGPDRTEGRSTLEDAASVLARPRPPFER